MVIKRLGLIVALGFLSNCTASKEEPKEPETEKIDPNAPAQPTDGVPSISEPTSSADIAAKEVAEGKVPRPADQTFKEEDGTNPGSLTDEGASAGVDAYNNATNGEPGYRPEKPLDNANVVTPPDIDNGNVIPPPMTGDDSIATTPTSEGTKARAGKRKGRSSNNIVSTEPPATNDNGSYGVGRQKRYIKAYQLNVREKPSRFSAIVGRVKQGDVVMVTTKGKWAKLGENQWVRTRYLTTVSSGNGATKVKAKKARRRRIKSN